MKVGTIHAKANRNGDDALSTSALGQRQSIASNFSSRRRARNAATPPRIASGHGNSIAGNTTRYHHGGRPCALVPLTPLMRSSVWLRKIARAYSAPPWIAAGIAHASAIAAPSSTASANAPK
jgi:hypothetical protein